MISCDPAGGLSSVALAWPPQLWCIPCEQRYQALRAPSSASTLAVSTDTLSLSPRLLDSSGLI